MLGSYICFCLLLIALFYALLYSSSMVENFFAITMEGVNSLFFKNNTLVAVVCGRGIFLFCGTDLIVDSGGLLEAACSVRRSSEEVQKNSRSNSDEKSREDQRRSEKV